MTADQTKKLEELQELLWDMSGVDGIPSETSIRARQIVHDLLATPHPFAEHWQEEPV